MSILSPFKTIGDQLERMSQRERVMAFALGVTLVLCIFFVGGYLVYSGLSDLEDSNAAMRQALRDIERKRGPYLQARAKIAALEGRIGVVPLSLSGFIEQTAKEASVDIKETTPRTPEPIGKKYTQQSMSIRMSKVPLEPLTKFMRKLELAPSNLVLITELSIRARDDKHVDFDVDMTVSTYEHQPKKARGKTEGAAAAEPEKEPG